MRSQKALEQHIAVFGEGGSGKTVLISSFYGATQEPQFLQEHAASDALAVGEDDVRAARAVEQDDADPPGRSPRTCSTGRERWLPGC
jgi:predicted ATPase